MSKAEATKDELLALIDIMAKPLQEGGMGMADCADSPLMKLRAKILEGEVPNER
jgi:hypothetical protein